MRDATIGIPREAPCPSPRRGHDVIQALRDSHYLRFVALSGAGWLLSLALLWIGVHALGLPVWTANALGDAVAITCVFLAAPQAVFGIGNPDKGRTLAVWSLWQVVHIALISWAVDALSHAARDTPLVALGTALEVAAKVAITPVTVTLNFFVARWLLRHARGHD